MAVQKLDQVEEVIKQICEEAGCRLYYFKRNATSLQVFIDKSNHTVSLTDCEKVSRKIKMFLEEKGLLDFLNLEVSSPGVERFLVYPWHFSEAVGQTVRIKASSEKNPSSFFGLLSSADDQGVVLKDETQSWSFDFKNIEKANIVFQNSRNEHIHST